MQKCYQELEFLHITKEQKGKTAENIVIAIVVWKQCNCLN